MNVVECYYCGENIKIQSTPRLNQFITCPFCKSVLQVSSVSPLSLLPLDEDWETEADNDSYRQNRRSITQQSRHISDDFDDDSSNRYSKGKHITSKRNNDRNKKNKLKLDFEMEE